jgi:glycosyltransferase involved in cell wall biosynthesis
VSVLVAAKDEEDNIETCVRTFLDQDYPNYEMIVIDDRSRDRTPHILAKLKSEFPARLKVITVTRLRDGWFGKNNAMREGVAVASGDWLLFCDADCRQTSRRTISAAIHEANAHKADFLSIIPVLDTYEIWERIIQPVCALILILWFLPSRVNDPRKKTAYANGQFMLLSRRCYDEIGGHERVRTQLNEDILMARHTKAGGLRLRVVENADLYRTRMYRTPREAWRGWSRIYAGSFGSVARVLTAMAVLLTFSLLPTTSLIIALIGSWLGEGASVAACRTAVWCWAGVILFQQMTLWRLYGILQMPRGWSFTYVIGAFAAMGILGNALLKTMGMSSTTWRGTTYHGERVTGGGAPSANSEAIPPPLSKPSPAD